MIAHNLYRKGYINEAYVMYAYMAELGYEVAQSNAAFLLDKRKYSYFIPSILLICKYKKATLCGSFTKSPICLGK